MAERTETDCHSNFTGHVLIWCDTGFESDVFDDANIGTANIELFNDQLSNYNDILINTDKRACSLHGATDHDYKHHLFGTTN